ncbi:MAG: S-adenosyl-l-methionine hydroxide adenosyltransferase family protein [Pseudomonadales bacterium]
MNNSYMKILAHISLLVLTFLTSTANGQHALVFQSDFGNKDGAVPSMKGVAYSVSSELQMFDLTQENTPYTIWEAAYRLNQTASYWPAGTVFVSVVDPGVGTHRKSVVLKTKTGHYFVTPDNGSLTLVAETMGIDAVREIDEAVNRLKGSEKSYTFHGRDVYAYTGARLAARVIDFQSVGTLLPAEVMSMPYEKSHLDGKQLKGHIPILDVQYGNVWTNIEREKLVALGMSPGDSAQVTISENGNVIYDETIPYVKTFGEVNKGKAAIYINDLLNVAFAINQGDFAATFGVNSGQQRSVMMVKVQ